MTFFVSWVIFHPSCYATRIRKVLKDFHSLLTAPALSIVGFLTIATSDGIYILLNCVVYFHLVEAKSMQSTIRLMKIFCLLFFNFSLPVLTKLHQNDVPLLVLYLFFTIYLLQLLSTSGLKKRRS